MNFVTSDFGVCSETRELKSPRDTSRPRGDASPPGLRFGQLRLPASATAQPLPLAAPRPCSCLAAARARRRFTAPRPGCRACSAKPHRTAAGTSFPSPAPRWRQGTPRLRETRPARSGRSSCRPHRPGVSGERRAPPLPGAQGGQGSPGRALRACAKPRAPRCPGSTGAAGVREGLGTPASRRALLREEGSHALPPHSLRCVPLGNGRARLTGGRAGAATRRRRGRGGCWARPL